MKENNFFDIIEGYLYLVNNDFVYSFHYFYYLSVKLSIEKFH